MPSMMPSARCAHSCTLSHHLSSAGRGAPIRRGCPPSDACLSTPSASCTSHAHVHVHVRAHMHTHLAGQTAARPPPLPSVHSSQRVHLAYVYIHIYACRALRRKGAPTVPLPQFLSRRKGQKGTHSSAGAVGKHEGNERPTRRQRSGVPRGQEAAGSPVALGRLVGQSALVLDENMLPETALCSFLQLDFSANWRILPANTLLYVSGPRADLRRGAM